MLEALLLGESKVMAEVRSLVRMVAPSNASVLVTGPSGSGKELVARAVHAASGRGANPFVAVNCGAIPRDLLESELFGHEKGAFTGALSQRRGRFEEAEGGTLFLDEIGDMPADMQVKLLRVLEERTVQRVGGRGEITVDSRIVSATHRDLDTAIGDQLFREDLYYRLAIFPIHLPSLAERVEDIPLLIARYLRRKTDVRFDQSAVDRLMAHSWPGNVRELRNLFDRATILYPSRTIGAEEVDALLGSRAKRAAPGGRLTAEEHGSEPDSADPAPAPAPAAVAPPLSRGEPIDLRSIIAELEHHYIAEALRQADGVVAEAARTLSLRRTTLIEKMRKYGFAKAA